MSRKIPCPQCKLLFTKGAAMRNHLLTHAETPHPNTGNPHGPKAIGVPQVRRRVPLALVEKIRLAEKHKLLL